MLKNSSKWQKKTTKLDKGKASSQHFWVFFLPQFLTRDLVDLCTLPCSREEIKKEEEDKADGGEEEGGRRRKGRRRGKRRRVRKKEKEDEGTTAATTTNIVCAHAV